MSDCTRCVELEGRIMDLVYARGAREHIHGRRVHLEAERRGRDMARMYVRHLLDRLDGRHLADLLSSGASRAAVRDAVDAWRLAYRDARERLEPLGPSPELKEAEQRWNEVVAQARGERAPSPWASLAGGLGELGEVEVGRDEYGVFAGSVSGTSPEVAARLEALGWVRSDDSWYLPL